MSYSLYFVIYYAYPVCTAHTHYIPLQYACYMLLNTLMSVVSMVYKLILHIPIVIPRYTLTEKCYTTAYQLVSLMCTSSRTSRPLAQHPLSNTAPPNGEELLHRHYLLTEGAVATVIVAIQLGVDHHHVYISAHTLY